MNATVKEAIDGTQGFDTATPLNASVCASLVEAGMQFAIRYVSFREPESRDLSVAEVQTILDAGLALMMVQHVRNPGWTPSAAMGTADGPAGLLAFGKLVLDEDAKAPFELRDVEGYRKAPGETPDRHVLAPWPGPYVTKVYPPSAFSGAEWDSEVKTKRLNVLRRAAHP